MLRALAIALLAYAPPALAQAAPGGPPDQVPEGPDTDDPVVIVSPYVWASSLGGNIGLAGYSAPVHLPFREIFDHLDAVAMGNVEFAWKRGGLYVDGQYSKTSQQEQLLGVPIDMTVKITRLSGGGFYKAIVVPLGADNASGGVRKLSIEPTAGLRWTQLAIRADSPIARAAKKANWTDPFVGLRLNADIARRWNLAAETDFVVGGDAHSGVNAQAYLGYRLSLGRQSTVLRLGYRYLKQDYSQPDFTGLGRFLWDTEQKGPVAGISMIF